MIYNIDMVTKTRHRLYSTWANMKDRCYQPNNKSYKYYGGRGIRVCDRWLKSANFIADMYPTHKEGLTLDRINTNGDYEPSNCRWATPTQQARNRRITQFYTINSQRVTLNEFAEITGISAGSVALRRYRGWTDEQIIAGKRPRTPHNAKHYEYLGKTYTLRDVANMHGIDIRTIAARRDMGWTIKQLVTGIGNKRQYKNLKVTT